VQKRMALNALLIVPTVALFAGSASAQTAKVGDGAGRWFFVNSDPPLTAKLSATKLRANIYFPAETSTTGCNVKLQSNMNKRAFETTTDLELPT